jgi:hypothetical protein
MRPTTNAESALRAPLSQILGRETHVRLLRVLAFRDDPISSADLARQTALDPAGVRRALDTLAQTGVIELVGTGSSRQVRLRSAHPLMGTLRALYLEERRRADAVVEAIRQAAETLTPTPHSVWVNDPVARTPADLMEPIGVGVLTGSKTAAQTLEHLELALADIELAYDVTLEPRVWTRADLAAIAPDDRAALQRAVPVFGAPPLSFVDPPTLTTWRSPAHQITPSHADLDARSRILAAAIAKKLAHDPDLVRQARAALARQIENAAPGNAHALREWHQLLRTLSPTKLRLFLVDPGPRATRLRQSLPFVDVLTPEERDAILATAPHRQRTQL